MSLSNIDYEVSNVHDLRYDCGRMFVDMVAKASMYTHV